MQFLKYIAIVVVSVIVTFFATKKSDQDQSNHSVQNQKSTHSESDRSQKYDSDELNSKALDQAIQARSQDVLVTGTAKIIKVLPDDRSGSKHQKFLIKTDNQRTVLVAHNIDLAPRVAGITENTPISFQGDYIWNEKGGVLHWTHHDPQRQHADGWLSYQGKKYQ